MLTDKKVNIAILGISDNPSRYSFMAMKKLLDNGYNNIVGISPKMPQLSDIKVVGNLRDLTESIHTLTVYVGSKRLDCMIDDIIKLGPTRIILNPGTENEDLEVKAQKAGIEIFRACTLVLLSTDQF